MLQSWKPHLIVYIFSCLFTFSSAICLLFGQLFVYNLNFCAKNLGLPSVFCQNNASKLETSPDCLHFQLFVYICQLFVYNFSCLFTIGTKILVFQRLFCHNSFFKASNSADLFTISAICLQFQLFVYFLS